MRSRVVEALRLVVGTGDDAIAANYDRSDGHFAFCGGLTRLVEGTAHEVFVIKRLYGHRRISFSLKSVG